MAVRIEAGAGERGRPEVKKKKKGPKFGRREGAVSCYWIGLVYDWAATSSINQVSEKREVLQMPWRQTEAEAKEEIIIAVIIIGFFILSLRYRHDTCCTCLSARTLSKFRSLCIKIIS